MLLVKLRPGATSSADEIRSFLAPKLAKWWIPDEIVFVDEIPLGPTGKTDKKTLRRLMHGVLRAL